MAGILGKAARKAGNILLHPGNHLLNFLAHSCNVCGRPTMFICDEPKDPDLRKCLWCRSIPKYRAIMSVLEARLGLPPREWLEAGRGVIYELSTTSPIHKALCGHPRYVCSGYFPDKPLKTELRPRVYNLDLQDLVFEDGSLDVVISSDSLEHVPDYRAALAEIFRVLKPGGFHCFTVPYHPERKTVTRAYLKDGQTVHLLEPSYHLDPYQPQGCLAYTDFGGDLPDILEEAGFRADVVEVLDQRHDIQDDHRPVPVFLAVKPGA